MAQEGRYSPPDPGLLHWNKDSGMNEQKKKKEVCHICFSSYAKYNLLSEAQGSRWSLYFHNDHLTVLGKKKNTPKWKIVLRCKVIQCCGDLNNCGNPSFLITPSQQCEAAGGPLHSWLRCLAVRCQFWLALQLHGLKPRSSLPDLLTSYAGFCSSVQAQILRFCTCFPWDLNCSCQPLN